jgi:hypothetical protein
MARKRRDLGTPPPDMLPSQERRAIADDHNVKSATAEFLHAATHLVRLASEAIEILFEQLNEEREE